nr:heparin sulfate O-sulfotransferase-like isoform X2 [Lepeophtheirus salmonis]
MEEVMKLVLMEYSEEGMDQITFVNNITSWSKRLPALYHGHFSYLNFERLGSPLSPLYINMIRRPIDRLVSYYYFLRYGDDYRVNKIRSRMGDKVTFDECVEKKLPDCDPKKLWIQVPWFCGHFRRCSEPGSRWALEQAKLNVARSYFLVGLTEDIEGFIDILEKSLPQFFKGAGTMYRSSGPKKYVRKTRHKDAVSEATIEALRNTKIWRIENEFYEFVASHYRAIKGDLESQANSQKLFHYQKVRP